MKPDNLVVTTVVLDWIRRATRAKGFTLHVIALGTCRLLGLRLDRLVTRSR